MEKQQLARIDPEGAADIGTPLDVEAIRSDFPALHQEVHGKPLVYLDNAASAHKPKAVLEAMESVYTRDYSNVHRGVHTLSQRATDRYEKARATARAFLGAERDEEVIFVRGATEAINLVASSFARPRLGPGDEVVISTLEHHSNIVPWQMACEETGARLRVVPIDDRGQLDLDAYADLLSERTRMVSMVHVSNALGTINPASEIARIAKDRGIPGLFDGAQATPHGAIDLGELGCDFYAVSGHKLYGPTGIGVLYGRYELLANMRPYHGGGDMIRSVSFEKTEYADPPNRFEAGTPNIAGAIGLAAAMDYVEGVGYAAIHEHEQRLLAYATERLSKLPGLRIVGTAEKKASVVSFVLDSAHAHDIGTILDYEGIAVRAGHHCTQPLMDRLGLAATARASFGLYNTLREIDALADALEKVIEMFEK
ncbi:MAG: cysteine desulfurase [Holophagales bacterium]|nr:cysteine desulfurase [Holophagales bacterium]